MIKTVGASRSASDNKLVNQYIMYPSCTGKYPGTPRTGTEMTMYLCCKTSTVPFINTRQDRYILCGLKCIMKNMLIVLLHILAPFLASGVYKS